MDLSGNNVCLKYQNIPSGKSVLMKNHSVSLIQPFISYVLAPWLLPLKSFSERWTSRPATDEFSIYTWLKSTLVNDWGNRNLTNSFFVFYPNRVVTVCAVWRSPSYKTLYYTMNDTIKCTPLCFTTFVIFQFTNLNDLCSGGAI